MTEVASLPSLQPLPRLGWNSNKNSKGGLKSGDTAGEVSRIFGAKKSPQRTDSSSSVSTTLSLSSSQNSASTNTSIDSESDKHSAASVEAEPDGRPPTKSARTLWTPQKAEASIALPTGRQAVIPLSSTSANPTQLAERPAQPSLGFPQSKMQQPQQPNGTRAAQGQANADPPAVLFLLPMNGTFERKQITVPYFPDILRIGRQTNAKTVPTPANGYFDSKVLSRQHAEVWADRSGKIWIRDVKSSNGTFVNGVRLSPESRDSEPHELRDNDMLELGIDIVSEDQKSIVHHKVSAKIEHAGIQANTSSVLDLNLGDIDPGSGGGMMGGMMPQQHHMRGRTGSQGSVASSGRMSTQSANGAVNGIGVQRHMNAWLSPVSIEQVMRRLGNELKHAKQQAQDLHRASDFFQAVLNSPPGQVLPKPPSSVLPSSKPQTNGTSPKKTEMLPFSQPPAPPPQQPLPEKPDAAQQLSFRRSESEKMQSPKSGLSPNKLEPTSAQLLNLAESLASAKRDLEASSSRISQLEEMLKQERKARELAEGRTRQLLEKAGPAEQASDERNGELAALDALAAEPQLGDAETASIASASSEETVVQADELASAEWPAAAAAAASEASTADDGAHALLRSQLALALAEVEEVKTQMERHRRRAEAAEEERSTLEAMVDRIRHEAAHSSAGSGPGGSPKRSRGLPQHSPNASTAADAAAATSGAIANGSAHGGKHGGAAGANGVAGTGGLKQLQGALVHRKPRLDDDDEAAAREAMARAAPYASILGVVLLGVGIMAYLNGWQKVER